jgi:hypothetical protein
MPEAEQRKRCFLHIGTHKTGTTSLQAFFSRHEQWLSKRGVYYPRAGRTEFGHHNLAWQLYGDPRFEARFGTVEGLRSELLRCRVPVVAISSEDFCLLYDLPDAIERLIEAIQGGGFDPVVVLHVRSQIDFIESLYATYASLAGRHPNFAYLPARSFNDVADEGFRTGAVTLMRSTLLEYDVLADAFARLIGERRIIVRAYTAAAPPSELLAAWLSLCAVPLNGWTDRRVRDAAVEGRRPTFAAIFRALGVKLEEDVSYDLSIAGDAPFHVCELADIERWTRRFAASNERLFQRFGVRLKAVSDARLRLAWKSESANEERQCAMRRLREGMRRYRVRALQAG